VDDGLVTRDHPNTIEFFIPDSLVVGEPYYLEIVSQYGSGTGLLKVPRGCRLTSALHRRCSIGGAAIPSWPDEFFAPGPHRAVLHHREAVLATAEMATIRGRPATFIG
jgi:hypothetical protein